MGPSLELPNGSYQLSKTPLRVLFLTPYFRPYLGGIERAIEQLSFKLMESAEVEAVAVLTTKYAFPRIPHPDWADRDATPEGIGIYRLKGFPKQSIPLYSVPLVWFSPGQVREYLEEFNPNVVHFVGDGWFWGHFWSWFWFRKKAEFIFTPSYHTLPVSRWWLRPINGFICNVMDHVIALTSQEAQQLRRDYWVPQSKQGIIGWGASPMSPNIREEALSGGNGDGPDVLNILCVGRLGHHKGQEWLLNVYHQALPQMARPTRLVLVGRDEGGEAALRQTVADSGLDDRVIFTGELSDEDLAAWYARADVFTLFSQYEAFGLVFFEAMVCGVPVLTHDVGASLELLTQGAVVVPRFAEQPAVDSLVRLVNDDEYREKMGQEAQEYALAEFTWAAVAEKYLNVYRTSTGGSNR